MRISVQCKFYKAVNNRHGHKTALKKYACRIIMRKPKAVARKRYSRQHGKPAVEQTKRNCSLSCYALNSGISLKVHKMVIFSV